MKINYQLELDRLIAGLDTTPKILLHACCAPCSSYVLKYLSQHFNIDLFYYNPNTYPPEEYKKRGRELERLITLMDFPNPVGMVPAIYDPERFYRAVTGQEKEREGGARCATCFRVRLEETAKQALASGYDYFATTLTVSPHTNAQLINQIGLELEREYGVKYLISDFKKREGYKQSIELSAKYNLYRQVYCGCEYSLEYNLSNKETRS